HAPVNPLMRRRVHALPHHSPRGPGLPLPGESSASNGLENEPGDPEEEAARRDGCAGLKVKAGRPAGRPAAFVRAFARYFWILRSRGPTYAARGRMSRFSRYCSRKLAVHPDMRLAAKMGV